MSDLLDIILYIILVILIALLAYLVPSIDFKREFKSKCSLIEEFQGVYNCIVFDLMRMLIFKMNIRYINDYNLESIYQKEVAYHYSERFNQKKCPISLEKFNKSFDETILICCGHKYNKESLNLYENYNLIYESNEPFQCICPLCKHKYYINFERWDYNNSFYQTESILYNTPAWKLSKRKH